MRLFNDSLFLDFFHKWNNNHMNPNITETFQINNYSSRDYIDCRKNETSDNNSIKNLSRQNLLFVLNFAKIIKNNS